MFRYCLLLLVLSNGVAAFQAHGQITVQPSDIVPMGTEIKLTATAITGKWERACKGSPPWNSRPSWTTPEIFDCFEIPGEQVYRVTIDNISRTKSVLFKAPDQAVTTVSGLLQYNTPQLLPTDEPIPADTEVVETFEPLASVPPGMLIQRMETRLRWNGKDLGKCAKLCFQESVKAIPTRQGEELVKN